MKREEYIKQLIREKGFNIKSFAKLIGIPSTTLYTALKEGKFRGTSLNNVIKICNGLGISIDMLEPTKNINEKSEITKHEILLIKAYRNNPHMQVAIDKLLEI